jgi:hypothetical protein
MKRAISVWVLMSLLLPLSWASAQSTGRPGPEYWFAYASKLPIGATVVVRTTDGKRQSGVLAVVDQDGITVQRRSRVPEPPHRIPFSELTQLELKDSGSSVGKAIAVGIAAGAATFFGIFLVMVAAIGD